MKRKMLVALSVALALVLAPVGGHLVATAVGSDFRSFDMVAHAQETISGNEGGTVSGNEGGTVSGNEGGSVSGNEGGNINNDGSNNNSNGDGDRGGTGNTQNTNAGGQNAGEQVTTGPTVTVTTSDGKQVVTTVPISNSSSEVQSVAIVTPKAEVNEFAGLNAQQISEGQYVAVTVANSQCGENAKKAINNAAMSVDANVATILEIDLGIFSQSGVQIGKVTDLSEPIQFTISTPTNVANPADFDFALVHLHNGQTKILPDMDTDPATITVETDGFSVYAVVYGEPGSFDAFRTAGVKDSVPKTGAELPMVFPAVAAGVLLAAAAVVVWKKKKEN